MPQAGTGEVSGGEGPTNHSGHGTQAGHAAWTGGVRGGKALSSTPEGTYVVYIHSRRYMCSVHTLQKVHV